MTERFATVTEARAYVSNSEEYRAYLARKSDEGLRGQAQAALLDQELPLLRGGEDRHQLLQIALDRYFPRVAEAIEVITGPVRHPAEYHQGDLVRYRVGDERWTVDEFLPATGGRGPLVLIGRSRLADEIIRTEGTGAFTDELELITPAAERSIGSSVTVDGLTITFDKGGDVIESWSDGERATA